MKAMMQGPVEFKRGAGDVRVSFWLYVEGSYCSHIVLNVDWDMLDRLPPSLRPAAKQMLSSKIGETLSLDINPEVLEVFGPLEATWASIEPPALVFRYTTDRGASDRWVLTRPMVNVFPSWLNSWLSGVWAQMPRGCVAILTAAEVQAEKTAALPSPGDDLDEWLEKAARSLAIDRRVHWVHQSAVSGSERADGHAKQLQAQMEALKKTLVATQKEMDTKTANAFKDIGAQLRQMGRGKRP